jgi:hypothetical protein
MMMRMMMMMMMMRMMMMMMMMRMMMIRRRRRRQRRRRRSQRKARGWHRHHGCSLPRRRGRALSLALPRSVSLYLFSLSPRHLEPASAAARTGLHFDILILLRKFA